jgi:phosphate acetyltransferase
MSVVPIECGDAHAKDDRLIALAKQAPAAITLVVYPCDEASLRGACEAAETGIIKPVLVGPSTKIKAVAAQHNFVRRPSVTSA